MANLPLFAQIEQSDPETPIQTNSAPESAETVASDISGTQCPEEEIAEVQFGYSLSDIFDKLAIISCESSTGTRSGGGFISSMDGKTYLFTSQTLLLGADKITFKTAAGETLRPRSVEISTSRDIVRLRLSDETEGFSIADDIPMGSLAGVFGNNGSEEVSAELYGKVTGVGAEIIEVSADFISENSGCPVLNLDREVIGIASHVRNSSDHAMKAGTKFENRTRHFCLRLTGNRWTKVNWKKFNKEYGNFYRKNDLFTEGIFNVFSSWKEGPTEKVCIENNKERALTTWATTHNEIIRGKSRKKPRAFNADYSKSLEDLADSCTGRARQIRIFTEQHKLTDFLRTELNTQAGTMDYAAEALNRISHTAQDFR